MMKPLAMCRMIVMLNLFQYLTFSAVLKVRP